MVHVCEECRAEIDPEASTCPHCGHEGAEASKAPAVFGFLIGGVLTMTVLGAIVGLPIIWWSLRKYRAAEDVSPSIEV